ncbi:YitT family protein [Dellaglioa sp. BT-FLS60]
MLKNERIKLIDLIMIALGCCFYAFGLATVNITNHLAEGGITGVTLILRYWFHIDPAYSTLAINIPLIIIGYRFLGKRSLIYTIYGTIMLSAFLWIWQRVPIHIDVNNDLFLAGILAGAFGGLGSGLVYRFGGTTGGTDVVARILEKTRGIQMGKTILALDVAVLIISLSYLDLRHMMYTLLSSYVFSRIVNFTLEGSYSGLGILIISNQYQMITNEIWSKLERGVSYINGEGSYSHQDKKMIYIVINRNELHQLKEIIQTLDPNAFVSISNVNEVLGQGFSYDRQKKNKISQIFNK